MPVTLPEWAASLNIPIDKETYNKDLDLTGDITLTHAMINGHIICNHERFIRYKWRDRKLHTEFKEEFGNWNEVMWKAADRDLRKGLRDYLRKYGVYVAKDNAPMGNNLVKCAQLESAHEWTQQEVDDQIRVEGEFYSIWNLAWKAPEGYREQARGLSFKNNNKETPAQQEETLSQRAPPQEGSTPPSDNGDDDDFADPPTDLNEHNNKLPKMITDLARLYNNDMKYGGGLYDMLDSKLHVFRDLCEKVGLPPHLYHRAFSIMLKDEASKWYYSKLARGHVTFETMVFRTKKHFETEENR